MELLCAINYPAIQIKISIKKKVTFVLLLQSKNKAFLLPAGNYSSLINLLSFPYAQRERVEQTHSGRCYMATERCDGAICDILAKFQEMSILSTPLLKRTKLKCFNFFFFFREVDRKLHIVDRKH